MIVSIASSGFESLVDDTHDLIIQFVGKRSYSCYGSINKRCREILLSKNLPKETYFCGYAPLSTIKDKLNKYLHGLGQAVVAYNRDDILQWLVLEKSSFAILSVFNFAAEVSLKTLKRVMNDVGDDAFTSMKINEDWRVSDRAARGERLDVLKWLKTKGWFDPSGIDTGMSEAAFKGNMPLLEWLVENGCENEFNVNIRRRMTARRSTPFEGPWSSSWNT